MCKVAIWSWAWFYGLTYLLILPRGVQTLQIWSESQIWSCEGARVPAVPLYFFPARCSSAYSPGISHRPWSRITLLRRSSFSHSLSAHQNAAGNVLSSKKPPPLRHKRNPRFGGPRTRQFENQSSEPHFGHSWQFKFEVRVDLDVKGIWYQVVRFDIAVNEDLRNSSSWYLSTS